MLAAIPVINPPDKYGLSRVAHGIWFVQGDAEKRPVNNDDPTLILLFGWMDGKLAHLAKYSAGYKQMFPYSNQIVVASQADIFILPKFLIKRRLQPVADLLAKLGVTGTSPSPHRILSHALSNGGACQLNYLSQILPRPLLGIKSAVVLDSTPGGDDIASILYVFRTTMPNPLLLYPFVAVLSLVHLVTFLLGRVPWHAHDIVRKVASNPQWLPWSGKQTPFLYIYSKADKSVPHRHIQAHTEVAERNGQDVTRLVYESSGHVSHMRTDPERYWGSIRDIWTKAVSKTA